MKKVYSLKNLGCANCALKMEEVVSRINGVKSVQVNFMTQKLTLDADDARFDEALETAKKTIRRIEPDCVVL